jgi:hypothetical protein
LTHTKRMYIAKFIIMKVIIWRNPNYYKNFVIYATMMKIILSNVQKGYWGMMPS